MATLEARGSGTGWLFVEYARRTPKEAGFVYLHLHLGDGVGRVRRVVLSEGLAGGLETQAQRDRAWRAGQALAIAGGALERHVRDEDWPLSGSTIVRGPGAAFEIVRRDHGSVRLVGAFDSLRFDLDAQAAAEPGRPARAGGGWIELGGVRRQLNAALVSAFAFTAGSRLLGQGRRVFLPSRGEWLDLPDDDEVAPDRTFVSGRTFQTYPVDLLATASGAKVRLTAVEDAQELNLLSFPPRWAGPCRVSDGSSDEVGYLIQCVGNSRSFDQSILPALNEAVVRQVSAILRRPAASPSPMCRGRDPASLPAALGDDDVADVLMPVREIAERGGKGWRGYTVAICCEASGGQFAAFPDWLALTEILHVGSLIVDDVEDDALERRGGPACHLLHGAPTAINAGSLAYFVAMNIIEATPVDLCRKALLYREFEALLRLAHVGQAIDIGLMQAPLPADVDDAALARMEARAAYANRLKSAVPFRGFARMGAILGEAEDEMIGLLGDLFLATGEAFQLLDDVLNITGVPGTPGKRGEDFRNGKLTIPLIRALRALDAAPRRATMEAFRAAANDPSAVDTVCEAVEGSGALLRCLVEIDGVADVECRKVAARVADPHAAYMVAAFVGRVLNSHY